MKHSIFTKMLAFVLCAIMVAGIMTSCLPDVEFNPPEFSTNGGANNNTTKPSTGDIVDKPVEDDPNQIFSASTELTDDSLIYGALASDLVIGGEEGMSAMLPADVKIAEGASALSLSVKKVEEEIEIGDAELVQSLDVHIHGIAANNTVPMLVNLGAILEAGLAETELKLYHQENGTAVLMTRVDSVDDFAIHNQYYYNAETGEVTIYVATFSVFTAVKSVADKLEGEADTSWYVGHEEEAEYTLTSAEQFAGFRDLVDSGVTFAGKTVKLGVDIDLEVKNENSELVSFDPIGKGYVHNGGQAFMGIFDGQGHTVSNLFQSGWDLGYYYGQSCGMGLFGWIGDSTIKNVNLDNAEISMEAVVMGGIAGYAAGDCTFENINVTNTQIANYNWDTGGIVGQVYGSGSNFVFKNITVDATNTISGHWGTWDVSAGGIIGRTADGVTVEMENITVAAVLDVYNDACAAYQWFAYRYSGMIVGYTKTTATDENGRTYATADHITCKNVTVIYGEWALYTYCQPSNVSPQYVRVQGGYSTDPYYSGRHWTAGVDANGNKMVDDNHVHTEGQAHNELHVFDQLFGGGQGVYGNPVHDGVTVIYNYDRSLIQD